MLMAMVGRVWARASGCNQWGKSTIQGSRMLQLIFLGSRRLGCFRGGERNGSRGQRRDGGGVVRWRGSEAAGRKGRNELS
eukprot:5470175-Pyramimonas_sp.AAC.2